MKKTKVKKFVKKADYPLKTKARNQMQLKLLDSIIRISAKLLLSNKCCKDFTPSTAILENLTSDKVYFDGHDIDDVDMELFILIEIPNTYIS